jgi:nitroreductase
MSGIVFLGTRDMGPIRDFYVDRVGMDIWHEQDGCIAAYHFIMSAWDHGIGTCWMAAMDRDDIKEWLDIPKGHYIATVTPIGYPYKVPRAPARRGSREFVRFVV